MLGAARLFVAAAALFAGTLSARAEPVSTPIADVVDSAEVRRENGAIRHLASGFLFPTALADMPARKLTAYAPDNMSVQYTLRGGANGDGWIDLYIYPAEGTLAEEAEALDALLIERYHGAALAAPEDFGPGDAGAKTGWFDADMDGQPYLTHYQLARHGSWAIKIRFTMPRDAASDVRERASAALANQPTRWR